MTQMDFVNGLEALRLNIETYLQTMSVNYPQYEIRKTTGARGTLVPMILASDWSGIIAYSNTQMANILTKVSGMEGEQTAINSLFTELATLKEGFSAYFKGIKSVPDWPTHQANLEADLATKGLSQAEIDALIKNMTNHAGLNGYNYYVKHINKLSEIISYAYERHLAQYIYMYHAKASADFNIAFATPQPLTYNISSKIYYLQNALEGKFENLYNKLRNEDYASALSSCQTYSTWVDSKMQSQIIPIMANLAQQRQSANNRFTTDGRRAMRAGDLFQTAIYAKGLFQWLAWYLQWHAEENRQEDVIEASNDLAISDISIPGDTVSVATLSNSPAPHDGDDVIIQGLLSNLTITHPYPGKVVSTAEVENSNGDKVKLVLPHIKLDSGGLVAGSYLKVSGKFHQANSEAGGQPAISIQRMSMTSMSKTNWNAWMRIQLKSVYQPVAHNLEMTFSAEPGVDGIMNPINYGTTNSAVNSLSTTNNIT